MAFKYKVIGFDLDGTLINTLPDLTLVVNSMFLEHGLPTVTQEKVLSWVGKGADIFFQNAVNYTGKLFDAMQLTSMRASFDKFYATYVCEESSLYPDVKETLEALERAEAMTHLNTGLILNFALNYGGRAEITQAVKQIAQEVLDAKFSPEDITEEMIADSLYTESLPRVLRDPDLIIRTSGEIRLSNFLPWQAAYSELYFTDVMWPDFGEEALRSAIVEYSHRHRRFGGV